MCNWHSSNQNSWFSAELELGKTTEILSDNSSKLPQQCWTVLDLLQSLLKPMPITVSSVGLFCSVGTCRLWNQTQLQLLSPRSPHSHQLVTTVTHYPLKMWSDWQHTYESHFSPSPQIQTINSPHWKESALSFLQKFVLLPKSIKKLPLNTCLYYIKLIETQSNLPATKNILKPVVPHQHTKRVFTCAGLEKTGRREGREWTSVLAG